MTFFIKIPSPTKKQLDELKRWFWVTTYSNYFTINSLSNQRKAFNQFIEFLNGNTDNSVFTDNESIPFRTLPFPEYLQLSAVRSKALILFELKNLRDISKRPFINTKGVYMEKLLPREKSIPENIIPLYFKNYVRNSNCYSLFTTKFEDDNICEQYLLPNSNAIYIDKEYLNERKRIIISKERMFVESLNLEYVEKR